MAYTYKDAYEDLETQLKQMGVKRSYNFNTPQMQEKLANGEAPFNEFASDRDKQMWNAYVKAYGGADSSYLPLSDGSYGAGISGPSGTTGNQSGTTTAGPGTGTTGTPASAIGDGTTGNMTLLSDTSGGGEHVLYWDNETQSTRDGWVIDGTLYSDETGTQMAAPGSHYAGGDGQYYVMEDGTMMYGPDYQRMLAEQAHQQRVENGFAIIDRQGNIVGHVSYDELLMAQNNEQGGGSSAAGRAVFGGYGVGYGNPGAGGDATAEAYIRQIYDQQIAANQAALENAYELNVNTINAQKQLLPVTYGRLETRRLRRRRYKEEISTNMLPPPDSQAARAGRRGYPCQTRCRATSRRSTRRRPTRSRRSTSS
jgi:hypothetical protein